MSKSKNLLLFLSFFAVACSTLILSVYFVCSVYLNKVSSESMQNWLQSEKVEIQEGNLLQAIMKNQRVLTSSEFIKGVTLVDLRQAKQSVLITLGKTINPEKLGDKSNEFRVLDDGFFRQIVVASIPSSNGLALAFLIDAEFLRLIFLVTSTGLILLFCLFSAIIYSLLKAESGRREKLILNQTKGKQLFAEMASRVAHDIRSPMAVLSRIPSSQLNNEEVRLIVNQVIGRLQLITDDLIKYWRLEMAGKLKVEDTNLSDENVNLLDLIQNLIEEKKNLFDHLDGINFHVDKNNFEVKFCVKPEFARHLSNIVDNAVEAVGLSGNITLILNESSNSIRLEIIDTGRGISSDILTILGKKKVSFGKSGGTGQGVYYASNYMRSVGGSLSIESTLGVGSKFSLVFPKLQNGFGIKKDLPIAYVDDDQLFHSVYVDFFKKKLGGEFRVKMFRNSEEYLRWAHSSSSHILFTDFDLRNESMNGLDLIDHALCSFDVHSTFLITNSYDSPSIMQRAKSLGIPILAKDKLSSYVFFQF